MWKGLAIDGGPKVRDRNWTPRGLFNEEEKQAAVALFDRAIAAGQAFGYNGAEEEAYCAEFAEFLGGGYADAVNSGTAAVYVGLRALEIPPFTEVICPPITDPGGVMPVPLINCIPVPADAAPDSYNVGAEQIAARITERTRAVIVAHISGTPCEMGPIMDLARAHGLKVLEDCAQAHGATCDGKPVGTFGDVAAFSTMSGKHHATGAQGGVVFARDEDTYWRARHASDRGKSFGRGGVKDNLVASLNLNQNDLAAAVGRVQLRKLPGVVAARRDVAQRIAARCADLRVVRPRLAPENMEGAYWFLFFKVDLDRISVDKKTFANAVKAEGIPVMPGYWHYWPDSAWYRNRAVFGGSGYPWAATEYSGDPDATYDTPNVRATDACHFVVHIHERVAEEDIEHLVVALERVAAVYVK